MIEVRDFLMADGPALIAFLETIAADEATTAVFHPHPFDAPAAARIIERVGITQDRYFGAFDGPGLVGYGMLRGWDEGYDVPSFGVCVLPSARGHGVAKALLDWAVAQAIECGAERMMLKVYKTNQPAFRLYERAGFAFAPHAEDPSQLVGHLDLRHPLPAR